MDNNSINNVNLPPGFRFYPTDEELVLHFLHRKKTPLLPFHPDVIPDLHLYSYDPWQLHGRALAEGNKWYYYSRRSTQNRVTCNGYWKPTGIEEPVFCSTKNNRIGIKKHFVFHMGESDSVGIKTNWIMHEFRLSHSSTNSSSSSSKIKSQPIKVCLIVYDEVEIKLLYYNS